MEAKSRQTDIKMTARKLRRVINEVRGKAVNEALDMLHFMPYFAARIVEKNVKAAAANAFEQAGVKSDALKVSEIYADWHITPEKRSLVPLIQLLNEKPQRIKAVLAGFLGYKDWIVKL